MCVCIYKIVHNRAIRPCHPVCVCVCIYKIEHNRAIRPCHPSHSMPLALILPKEESMILCVCVCVCVFIKRVCTKFIELHITARSDPRHFFLFSFISLIADGPHHYTILPVVTKDLPISPRFTPYDFLSRCKFSTLTTRQPMVEFYLLSFPRFPLRKKEHKSYFGKNRTHDFRTSRCAGYLLDWSTRATIIAILCNHRSHYLIIVILQ